MSTDPSQADDDVLCKAITSAPEGRNVRYFLPSNEDITDDIRDGTLWADGFGLLEALATEQRVTAAVLRCLATGRLYAHHDADGVVVLTKAPRQGDCFAFDGCAYVDGGVMYVEILEVVEHFADGVGHTGAATWGYRVAVYCDQEPRRAEDHYGWDFLDERRVPLSAADMMRARSAGWPSTYVRLREVLGNERALLDWRGDLVPSQGTGP